MPNLTTSPMRRSELFIGLALLGSIIVAACTRASPIPTVSGHLVSGQSLAGRPDEPMAGAVDVAPTVTPAFTFVDSQAREIRVFMHRPASADADAPVVFILHGVGRDADRFLLEWRDLADANGFVIVVPEFSQVNFARAAGYNFGGVVAADATTTARETWAYSVIEPLFEAIVAREQLAATHYTLYGHSAGAQFAHRFALFGAGLHAAQIISANAGWYTFPNDAAWPYGLTDIDPGAVDLSQAFATNLVVLLGDADIDPNHRSIRHDEFADAQGLHRFARGQSFFKTSQQIARSRQMTFNWQCVVAPGLDHNNALAATFAVRIINGAKPAHADDAGPDCRPLAE